MGKAADRRKASRAKYLSMLARSDPERFQREVNKRMCSWSAEIWKRAGKLEAEAAFPIIGEAQHVLSQLASNYEAHAAGDILRHEAAKAFSLRMDGRLYHLMVNPEKQ